MSYSFTSEGEGWALGKGGGFSEADNKRADAALSIALELGANREEAYLLRFWAGDYSSMSSSGEVDCPVLRDWVKTHLQKFEDEKKAHQEYSKKILDEFSEEGISPIIGGSHGGTVSFRVKDYQIDVCMLSGSGEEKVKKAFKIAQTVKNCLSVLGASKIDKNGYFFKGEEKLPLRFNYCYPKNSSQECENFAKFEPLILEKRALEKKPQTPKVKARIQEIKGLMK